MSSLSDEELEEYVEAYVNYTPAAITAAVFEMKRRGRIYTTEEANVIRAKILERKDTLAAESKSAISSMAEWKGNVVEDEEAPLLYSQRAIYLFSAFFSPLFGAILLAINVSKYADKRGVYEIVGFGVACLVGLGVFNSYFPDLHHAISVGANLAGAYALNNFFWNKHIGKTTYRARDIAVPLVIACAVTLVLLYFAIHSSE